MHAWQQKERKCDTCMLYRLEIMCQGENYNNAKILIGFIFQFCNQAIKKNACSDGLSRSWLYSQSKAKRSRHREQDMDWLFQCYFPCKSRTGRKTSGKLLVNIGLLLCKDYSRRNLITMLRKLACSGSPLPPSPYSPCSVPVSLTQLLSFLWWHGTLAWTTPFWFLSGLLVQNNDLLSLLSNNSILLWISPPRKSLHILKY
jgi:hypothetical protein